MPYLQRLPQKIPKTIPILLILANSCRHLGLKNNAISTPRTIVPSKRVQLAHCWNWLDCGRTTYGINKYTISVEGFTADAAVAVAELAVAHYEGSLRDKYYLLLWLISK